jgi:predicted transcriptional regulator of viral defense system
MTKEFLRGILKSSKTVYSFKELALLWPSIDAKTLKSRINYYVTHGDLYHIRRGLYGKDDSYDRFEVACKILSPSYISFETVLAQAGIIFQHYRQIFVASYQTKTIQCDNSEYVFKKIRDVILTNATGIEIKEYYSIASPERAFLDILYLNKSYYFDNLDPLNWDKVYQILPIYDNKRMEKEVKKYHKAFKEHV